jgi:hypothetical protein
VTFAIHRFAENPALFALTGKVSGLGVKVARIGAWGLDWPFLRVSQ